MSGMFNEWLMTTRVLQRQSFGVDPAHLEGEELVEYLRWNTLAATDELHEALAEVHWKPWGKAEPGFRNRDAFIDECVDVLHFVANLLVASGCSDEELTKRYEAKQQKNRERMASGTYDGHNEKCPACHRAYDDTETKCYKTDKGWNCNVLRVGTASASSLSTPNPYVQTWNGPPTVGANYTVSWSNETWAAYTASGTFPPPADLNDDPDDNDDDDEGESGVLV